MRLLEAPQLSARETARKHARSWSAFLGAFAGDLEGHFVPRKGDPQSIAGADSTLQTPPDCRLHSPGHDRSEHDGSVVAVQQIRPAGPSRAPMLPREQRQPLGTRDAADGLPLGPVLRVGTSSSRWVRAASVSRGVREGRSRVTIPTSLPSSMIGRQPMVRAQQIGRLTDRRRGRCGDRAAPTTVRRRSSLNQSDYHVLRRPHVPRERQRPGVRPSPRGARARPSRRPGDRPRGRPGLSSRGAEVTACVGRR
jgi:hypothetical protein